MKMELLILGIVLFCKAPASAQVGDLSARYYLTTRDYLEERLSDREVILEVNEMGEDYIYVRKVVDKDTRKRSKDGTWAWAIEYNGKAYLNLRYSMRTNAPQFYVMLDIKGKYCLAVMDQCFLKSLKKASPNIVMPGLIGSAAMAAAESWGADFSDSTGALKKVLVVDTREVSSITRNSPGEFLNRAKLKWFLGLNQLDGKLDDYSVEDILARAEKLNGMNVKQEQ